MSVSAGNHQRGAQRRSTQAGLTLVELMVVVIIVGVLSTLAVASLRTTPDTSATAGKLASHITEASRRAIAGGPVHEDVIAAEAEADARTRIVLESTMYTIEVREENADNTASEWKVVRVEALPDDISIAYLELNQTRLNSGNTVGTLPSAPNNVIRCNPSGGCQAATIYLKGKQASERHRVVIMPLQGTPEVFSDW
jgi:prepilin-type N-terminal cleavage/methylation domain-containing protein